MRDCRSAAKQVSRKGPRFCYDDDPHLKPQATLLNEINGHTLIGSELSDRSVVIDLGAHRGAFAHGVMNAFGCRCIAVEANPMLATEIPVHPRLSVHNLAIAGR